MTRLLMRAAAFFALLLAVVLSACQAPEKYTWIKTIDLLPVTKAGFHDYKKLSYPAYFAVTEDGRHFGYSFCSDSGCRGNAMMTAIYSCERRSRGAPCKIYAKGYRPVFSGSSDKSNAISTKGTFIEIQRPDTVYEYGEPKFSVAPGDELEVLRSKVCRSGWGICWEVQNVATGEIGYVIADRMKSWHRVYTKVK